uniref:Transmembrane protein 50A n=1 Tax=Acrobeloides nanus TaxID=290746 RepID=A0A914C1D9_9BILA
MTSCFDRIHVNFLNVDIENKRNVIASVAAGILFFGGWWLMIDTAANFTKTNEWSNVYIIVTIAGSIAMFMVNAVSNSQVQGVSMDEGILGTKGSRLWLMSAFVLSFACIVAATWIMFSDYVLQKTDKSNWPGVSLFIHNFMIFMASLVYKFGRSEEHWG